MIKKYNLPLKEFENLCLKWGDQRDIKLSKQAITSILILIQEFNLVHVKVNILVIKFHAFVLNNLLLKELKRELVTKVNFLAYEPSKIRNFETFDENIDFILSDIVLPKEILSIPHIYLSKQITDKKLQMIQKIVDDVVENKEKLTIKTSETN